MRQHEYSVDVGSHPSSAVSLQLVADYGFVIYQFLVARLIAIGCRNNYQGKSLITCPLELPTNFPRIQT